MDLVNIEFDKATRKHTLRYVDEAHKPYHIKVDHLLDKDKLWCRGSRYYQDPYRISWTRA